MSSLPPGPGVTSLLTRLAVGPIKLGSLFLSGEWTSQDVNWLLVQGLARSDGDTLRLTRKDGTR